MIKFKVDENLPVEAATLLTEAGHDALTATDQHLGGAPDPDIAATCKREGRGLVTLDLADIRVYPPQEYAGIIVFRLARAGKRQVLAAIDRLLPILEKEQLTGALWIVDESTVRIRR